MTPENPTEADDYSTTDKDRPTTTQHDGRMIDTPLVMEGPHLIKLESVRNRENQFN